MNPNFDSSHDPRLQAEYVNPVALNNKTIELANEYIAITSAWSKARTTAFKEKRALTTAVDKLADFEHNLLAQHPPNSGDSKTKKTLEAYVCRKVIETEQTAEYETLVKAVIQHREALEKAEMIMEQARNWLRAIELMGEQIQTHLSFVKNEMRASRQYT